MKIKPLLIFIIALSLSGCSDNSFRADYETTANIEPISSNNKLNEYTVHYTDVEYKYGKEILGQSIRLDIKKGDFDNISNSDFEEFVRINSKMNDNIIFAFEDNTALIFTNTNKIAKYGIWDLDLGITELIGEYKLADNNQYVYNEISKQKKEA